MVPLQPSEPNEAEDRDGLLIHGVSGRSFVVSPTGAIQDERQWVVPRSPSCLFPGNLSVAEADWAGWYNRDNDCVVMEELRWPAPQTPYPYQFIGAARESFLSKSVFSLVAEPQFAAIAGTTLPQCDIDVKLSNGVTLVGWLHPAVTEPMAAFERDLASGQMVMRPSENWPSEEEDLAMVRSTLASLQIEETSASLAAGVAKAVGVDLSGIPDTLDARSAELYWDFDQLPSPIHLAGRILLHVQMWEVPATPSEAQSMLAARELQILETGFAVHWQAKRGPKTQATFVMSSLQVPCPVERPTTDCVLTADAVDVLGRVERHVRELWPTALRATLDFWTREVGFRFENGRLVGNPFFVTGGVRYNITTDDPEPDD